MIKIYFLGTGAGAPSPSRWAPSILISVGPSNYLLDCGEGCQLRLLEAGISPLKIAAIFLTHGHGDHVLGVAPLIESMTHHGRKAPLYLVAPKAILDMIDATIRITSGGLGFEVVYREPSEAYEDSSVEVWGYRVCHKGESWGYRVAIKRRRYVICYTGDTEPCDDIVKGCSESQLLIHDATFAQDKDSEARESRHSTAYGAAFIARSIGVKYLYLTHVSSRYKDPGVVLEEARSVFRSARVAEDLMVTYII